MSDPIFEYYDGVVRASTQLISQAKDVIAGFRAFAAAAGSASGTNARIDAANEALQSYDKRTARMGKTAARIAQVLVSGKSIAELPDAERESIRGASLRCGKSLCRTLQAIAAAVPQEDNLANEARTLFANAPASFKPSGPPGTF